MEKLLYVRRAQWQLKPTINFIEDRKKLLTMNVSHPPTANALDTLIKPVTRFIDRIQKKTVDKFSIET